MISTIYEHYGIKPAELIDINQHKGFYHRNLLYLVVDGGHFDQEELYELHQMSQFLISQGEKRAASFMVNKSNEMITEENGRKFALCRVPYLPQTAVISHGKELASFHQKGKLFPYSIQKSNRIGQWKGLWEKRLEQLEAFWGMKVQQHPNDETDKCFIESFPYYLGLTENAIQYLTDTEIDDMPRAFDTAAICHHRFTPATWEKSSFIKMPTEWVFDHPSRDLAEYIRHLYIESASFSEKDMFHFLNEYEKTTPLSSFAWRLLYARLLFPVHYFEAIEGYYSAGSAGGKQAYAAQIEKILDGCTAYEQFLCNFYRSVGISTKRHHIAEIEWLQ